MPSGTELFSNQDPAATGTAGDDGQTDPRLNPNYNVERREGAMRQRMLEEQRLAQQLQQRLGTNEASLGYHQMQSGMADTQQQMAGAAAGGGGLANRQAMMAGAQGFGQVNAQTGAARSQEQLDAANMYQDTLARGTDTRLGMEAMASDETQQAVMRQAGYNAVQQREEQLGDEQDLWAYETALGVLSDPKMKRVVASPGQWKRGTSNPNASMGWRSNSGSFVDPNTGQVHQYGGSGPDPGYQYGSSPYEEGQGQGQGGSLNIRDQQTRRQANINNQYQYEVDQANKLQQQLSMDQGSLAYQQMQEGRALGQNALAAQGASVGSTSSQRAAAYGGGQVAHKTGQELAAIRSQEQNAAMANRLGVAARGTEVQMAHEGMTSAEIQAAQDAQLKQAELQQQQKEHEQEMLQGYVGGAVNVVASPGEWKQPADGPPPAYQRKPYSVTTEYRPPGDFRSRILDDKKNLEGYGMDEAGNLYDPKGKWLGKPADIEGKLYAHPDHPVHKERGQKLMRDDQNYANTAREFNRKMAEETRRKGYLKTGGRRDQFDSPESATYGGAPEMLYGEGHIPRVGGEEWVAPLVRKQFPGEAKMSGVGASVGRKIHDEQMAKQLQASRIKEYSEETGGEDIGGYYGEKTGKQYQEGDKHHPSERLRKSEGKPGVGPVSYKFEPVAQAYGWDEFRKAGSDDASKDEYYRSLAGDMEQAERTNEIAEKLSAMERREKTPSDYELDDMQAGKSKKKFRFYNRNIPTKRGQKEAAKGMDFGFQLREGPDDYSYTELTASPGDWKNVYEQTDQQMPSDEFARGLGQSPDQSSYADWQARYNETTGSLGDMRERFATHREPPPDDGKYERPDRGDQTAGGGKTGGLMGMAMSMMSDPRAKTVMSYLAEENRKLGEKLYGKGAWDELAAGTPLIEYEYNDRAQREYNMPAGRRVGTESTALNQAGPIGEGITTKGPEGLQMIKGDEGMGAALGLSAHVGRQNVEQDWRLRRIEDYLFGGQQYERS